MSRWEPGRDEVEAMLARGELEQVAPSADSAASLLAEAEQHLRSAELLAGADPAGSYDLLYAAAPRGHGGRSGRPRAAGHQPSGHIAVQQALTAQLGRSGDVIRRSLACGALATPPTIHGWTPRS